MKLRRMLALTLVLMTLMTAALAADDTDLYYVGDEAHSICTSSCWVRRKAIRCTFETTMKRQMRRCRLRFGWNGESENSIAYENPLPIPALGVNSGSFYVISLTEPSNLPSRKRQSRRHVRRRTRRRPLPSGQARRTTSAARPWWWRAFPRAHGRDPPA